MNQEQSPAVLDGTLSTEQQSLLTIRQKIQDNYLDLDPEETRSAWHNGWLNDEQVQNYMDYRKNPISFAIRDGFQGVWSGVRNAGQELIDGSESLINWAFDSEVNLPDLPKVDKPLTTVGNITEGISQFSAGFIPVAGVLGKVAALPKIAALASKAPKLANFLKVTTAGAIADATVFDPKQAGISELIEEHPALSNPITEFLKSDPNEPEWEMRLKNAAEGALMGLPVDGLLYGLKFLKGRIWKEAGEHSGRVAQEADKLTGVVGEAPVPKPTTASTMKLSETDLRKMTEETIEVVGNGAEYEMTVKAPFNYTRLDNAEDIVKVMNVVAENTAGKVNKYTLGVEARETTKLKAEEEFKKLGGFLGESVDHLRRTWKFMNEGPGFAATIQAHRLQLVTYGEEVAELARKAAAGSMVDVLKAREHIKMYAEVQNLFKGVQTQLARALGAFNNRMQSGRFMFEELHPGLLNELETESGQQLRKALQKFGDITDPYARAQHARDFGESKFLRGLLEARQSALLANPGTFVVNIVGNSLATGVHKMEKYLALAATGVMKRDASYFREIMADFYGGVMGLWDAMRLPYREVTKTTKTWQEVYKEHGLMAAADAVQASVYENPEVGNFWKALLTGQSSVDATQKFISGAIPDWAMGPVWRLPFKALTGVDEMFKNFAYHSELRGLAYREARSMGKEGDALVEHIAKVVTEPGEKFRIQALNRAREMTFSNPLGPTAATFNAFLNTPAMIPARIVLFPFYKIAINLMKFATDRSPLGLMTQRFRDDIAKGGIHRAEAISRVGVGTLMLGLGSMLYQNNIITGSATEEERSTWKNAGIPEYGIKLGGQWFRYNRGDPMSMWLGVAADCTKWLERYQLPDSKADELASAAIAIVSDNLLSKTYMRSLSEAMDIIFHSDRMDLGKWSRNVAATFVPFGTGMDAIVREVDPYTRQHETLFEAVVKTRTSPEDLVPRRHSVYGTPEERTKRAMFAFDKMEPTDDPVMQEMLRVGANVKSPSKLMTYGKQTIELNLRQMDAYQEIISQLPVKETLQRLITNPQYQRIGDAETQAAAIKKVISQFREKARQVYLTQNKSLLNEFQAKIQKKTDAILGIHAAPSTTEQLNHWAEYLRDD